MELKREGKGGRGLMELTFCKYIIKPHVVKMEFCSYMETWWSEREGRTRWNSWSGKEREQREGKAR